MPGSSLPPSPGDTGKRPQTPGRGGGWGVVRPHRRMRSADTTASPQASRDPR